MEDVRYQVNEERVLFSQLDEEGVLFDVVKNEYLSINQTFTSIFLCIQEGLTKSQILQRLTEEYEIGWGECEDELGKVIEKLMCLGFISVI